MARERTIEPADYLAYLKQAWNPQVAAEALGCDIADIRALQRSRKFVERYLAETVQLTGPESLQDIADKTALELIHDQKMESYWALREMGMDQNVPANVRARIHGKFFDAALTMDGLNQKIQHEHTITHRLDPESAAALESARAESSRLIAAPIDVTPDGRP